MPDTPEVIAARQQAGQVNMTIRNAPGITAPTDPQADLGTVLGVNTSTVKYSDSGAGGAVLVMPGPDLPKGAAIKIEAESAVKTAEKCSQLMEDFFSQATGPAPFVAPRIQVYRKDDFIADQQLQTDLAAKVGSLAGDANVKGRWGFEATVKSVGTLTTGDTAVLMMEFAEGQQMNKLPTPEKEALVRSEAFAQQMGRAMAPSMALGLNDHGGIEDMGSGHKANISNFMYSPKTGTLSVIDYSSGDKAVDETDPTNLDRRVGAGETAENFQKMRTFLEKAASSPAEFEKAIEAMCKPGSNTPFNAMMESFSKHSYDGMFGKGDKNGNPVDQAALKSFSMEDRKDFAANLLIGAVDGMEYVQQNQQALENAVTNTHEVGSNGETIEHFYTQQEMADLRQELGQLNAQNLRTNLKQFQDARTLKESTDLAPYIADLDRKIQDAQQRVEAANAKIDHLRDHPSAGERLKSAFSTKGHSPMDKAIAERDKALKDLQFASDLRDVANGRKEHVDKMRLQSQLPPIPQRPAPPLPGNNVGQDNNVQQQVQAPKPHVRDLLYGSHDDHGHGQSQSKLSLSGHRNTRDSQQGLDDSQGTGKDLEKGLKTGEKSPKLNDSSGHHSVGQDNPDLAKHLSQSRGQSHDQSHGTHVKH